MRKILKPAWKFSQSGNLWSIYSSGKNFLTGETKDKSSKKSYFFTIDAKSGKIILKDYIFNEKDSFISSIAASENFLFLNRLVNPELAVHRGIIALDIMTGNKIWENTELEYMFHTSNFVYTKKIEFENIKYQKLDINTGEILENYEENENSIIFEIRKQTFEKDLESENNFPVFNIEFASEKAKEIFEYETKAENGIGDIEFIELNTLLIFTYHIAIEKGFFEVYICIYDKTDGKKLYKEKIYKKSTAGFP